MEDLSAVRATLRKRLLSATDRKKAKKVNPYLMVEALTARRPWSPPGMGNCVGQNSEYDPIHKL